MSPELRLYIGTSGWSYPKGQGTWEGTFYPPKLADKDKWGGGFELLRAAPTPTDRAPVDTPSGRVARCPADANPATACTALRNASRRAVTRLMGTWGQSRGGPTILSHT